MVSIPSNRADPTGTATLRRRYAAKLRGQFADLNTLIRRGVIENDIFGLTSEALEDPPGFEFSTDREKREGFVRWLAREEQQGVLETIQRDENTYIRSAYSRGLKDANQALKQEGIDIPDEDIQQLFNSGVHQQSVQRLYEANYRDLEGITQVMNQQIGEELAEGFAKGENPRKIARRISGRVDKIGKTRAQTLAQTRVIDAYSDSTLNRYEQMGVGSVTIKAEVLTAEDERVCPLCESISGEVMSITEVRDGTFNYQAEEGEPSSHSGEWPIKPPIHPRCRCRVIPMTS